MFNIKAVSIRFLLQAPEQNNQKSVFLMFCLSFFPRKACDRCIQLNPPSSWGCSRNGDPTWFDPASIEIDESNSGIRMAQRGRRISEEVKVEPAEEAIVPCAQLLFTQGECSAYFKGGPYKNKHLNDFNRFHPGPDFQRPQGKLRAHIEREVVVGLGHYEV